jgi:hypothetical protein
MSEDWDCYMTSVNGFVSAIFVDLSLRYELPFADRPRLLWVFLQLNSPRPDGLSSSDESPELYKIEDQLVPAMESECGARFVGKITGAGRREFYFYANPASSFEPIVKRIMAVFSTYRVDLGEHDDPEWTHYLNVLYPSPREMTTIQNDRVLRVLEKHGDDHSISRPVSHWAYFKSADARVRCAKKLTEQGFELIGELDGADHSAKLPFRLVFQRSDRVENRVIDEVTWALGELVNEYEGKYDGWETGVEKIDHDARAKRSSHVT